MSFFCALSFALGIWLFVYTFINDMRIKMLDEELEDLRKEVKKWKQEISDSQ